jgi:hypothetical protein
MATDNMMPSIRELFKHYIDKFEIAIYIENYLATTMQSEIR